MDVLLESVPDPERARLFFSRFRRQQPEAYTEISASPTALRYLITTFSFSNFLAEEVIQHPDWLRGVASSNDLQRVLSAEEYEDRLRGFLSASGAEPMALELSRFRRRSLLRIMLRDVLGLGSLSDVVEELSNLSDAILEVAYRTIREEVAARHGLPRRIDASGKKRECGFAVISLGKLGGKELNYSSDIDLMFVYGGAGETDGPEAVSNKEFFKKVANRYTEMLSTYTVEGMCYRVDLRLRPDGRLGEACISLDGARDYYQSRARDWELQMLIKARVSAGDRAVGRALLEYVEPFIYKSTLDFGAVEVVSETRQRISEKLAGRKAASRRGPETIDVKLSPGGIRDIEFLVQCLQRLHGGREPWVRHGGTQFALFRLRDKGLLSGPEYSRLASAYEFLRHLEHRLQILDDRQTHSLPFDREELDLLARKMPLGPLGGSANFETLIEQLKKHQSEVRELYERVIHAQKPMYYTAILPAPEVPDGDPSLPDGPAPLLASNLVRFLDSKAPNLSLLIQRSRLVRGRERFEHFLEKVISSPVWLDRLEYDAPLAECTVDLFEHSQFFGDQLLRNPDLLAELCAAPRTSSPDPPEEPGELRRFFWREMLRIQSESVFERVPVFTTLLRTSDLADQVIAAAYRMAVRKRLDTGTVPAAGYQPRDRMLVVALGRLGVREFDLASDADLCFIIPDGDAAHELFWTGVAEAMIDIISSYTKDGIIFSVDTRLRPNGREGALVQTEAAYKDYFAHHAEAWEGIAYMKSRAVAGDQEQATRFLNELQDVDWRRYGQSGRSRAQLSEMRKRLEKEQGSRNPLKASRGGYYDIDFALMYLRLRGAGIFFKVLNTPERIDVIEKMGHIEREDADFLRDAAVFYRAIDHAMRVWSGQAGGKLPSAAAQLEILTDLVRRWTPERLHQKSLPAQFAEIRNRTHDLFERIFR